jgi:adenosine deaminase
MERSFRNLPKVELHLHLDCCLSYHAVQRLDPSITADAYRRDFIAPAKCRSLADYLRTPPHFVRLMQTEEGLRVAVEDLFSQLAADGVFYAEMRFAPLQHLHGGLTAERVVEAVEAAVAAQNAKGGVQARVILCTLRHFSSGQSLETVRLVEQFRGTNIVAFDIAGDEAGYPVTAHRAAFAYAIEHGLPRTAHAGEASGPASVWQTLSEFRPSRIGHGVRSIEDGALIAQLRHAGIHLEVCPSCNVQIGIAPDYAGHPVDRLYRSGVSLGVSTDTRTITDVDLMTEYDRLHHTFGWAMPEFRAVNLNAARAAFLPDSERRQLTERVAAAYDALD